MLPAKPLRSLFAVLLATLAACVPQPKAPPVEPPPPRAEPLPPPPPSLSADWRDWPVTPGDWTYARDGAGSVARFGPTGAPLLTLACDVAARRIDVVRAGTGTGPLTVRTSSATRTLAATAGAGGASAALAATDPLLEAMGFSRGRFIVEQGGQATLVVPAWAEIERVTEDCRG